MYGTYVCHLLWGLLRLTKIHFEPENSKILEFLSLRSKKLSLTNASLTIESQVAWATWSFWDIETHAGGQNLQSGIWPVYSLCFRNPLTAIWAVSYRS